MEKSTFPVTLLVVDDSPEDRETVLRTIRRAYPQWRLVTAETGEEAQERFTATPPDLVLLDLHLPDADGIELLPLFNGNGERPVPVVLLTGQGNEAVAVRALKLGARDYLVKDVAGSYRGVLAETLERALEQHRLEQTQRKRLQDVEGYHRSLEQIAERRGLDLERLQHRIKTVVEQTMDGLLVIGRGDGTVLLSNPAAEEILLRDGGLLRRLNAENTLDDGEEIVLPAQQPSAPATVLELRSRPLHWDGEAATLFVLHDISVRKAAEQALVDSKNRFKRLLQSAPDAVVISDQDGTIRIVNDATQEMFAYEENELLGEPVERLLPEGLRERHARQRENYLRAPVARLMNRASTLAARRRDGSEFPVEITLSPMEGSDGLLVIAMVRDVSGRLRAEQRLKRLNRTYEMLSQGNHLLVRAQDEPSLLDAYCRNLVEDGGYLLAWVAYAGPGPDKRVRVVASAGKDDGYLAAADIRWDDSPRGRGPTGQAIRGGEAVVCRDIAEDPGYGPWRDAALALGFRASIALPLTEEETVYGAFNIYSGNRGHFDDDEVRLLKEMADDLAYGIRNLRGERARKQAEEILRLRNRAVEAAHNGIMLTDARIGGDPIVYVNPAFERITGYRAEDALGRNPRFLSRDDGEQANIDNVRAALRERREGTAILRNYRRDGSLFWNHLHVAPVADEAGEVTHFVGVISDVTNEKTYLDELEHQATHDQLTGLHNRNLMRDRLLQAISMAARSGRHVGVLFLDLDRFKLVNDSLGHGAGDELLQAVARRLLSCVREGDTVARYGGDEFVIILPDLDTPDECNRCAERLLARSGDVIEIAGEEMRASLTIGAAVYPRDGGDPDTLLKNADAAMYRGKQDPNNSLCFFTDDLSGEARERLHLERDLRRALEHDQLLLHYQPQIRLDGGRCAGVEALVRWQHPERGLIPPDRFIPLAEESGLILFLGEWVLREACRQAAAWSVSGQPPLEMAVNVSARQLQQEGFIDMVEAALDASGLAPERLELELTESILMADPELMLERLRALKALGVKLSLDDFGTGYSSLSYLKRYPFDRLKIDRSFVQDLPGDSNDAAIASTIVAMARNLGLGVVAEGVETEAQRDFLLREGCDCGQGWLFARPMPAVDLWRFVQQEKCTISAHMA